MDKASYQAGFQRCLTLNDTVDPTCKYSPDFEAALYDYFRAYSLEEHPRLPEWWAHHTGQRVAYALNVFMPWCKSFVTFDHASILEIGCGTGSSTVALATHSDHVVACDMHMPSLRVAKLRLEEDGFADKVVFLQTSPGLDDIVNLPQEFDVVVLYAVLEHMLPSERQRVFDVIWQVLIPGGHIVVYETPNRLWPRDRHTTGLAGWSYLPPQLALKYGKWRHRFESSMDLEYMYRLGYGLTYWDISRWLVGKRYHVNSRRFNLPSYMAVISRLLRVPNWGLQPNLDIVITKL